MMKYLPMRNYYISIVKLFLLFAILLTTACGGGKPGDVDINNANTVKQVDLTAPQNIRYTEFNGKITISWSSVKGAKHYKIYLATEAGIDRENVNSETTTVFDLINDSKIVLPELIKNSPYYVVISSVNSDGDEIASPEFSVLLTTGNIEITLVPPQNFSATPQEGAVNLSWDSLPEAINYILYYSEFDSQVDPENAMQIREIAQTTFNHEHLSTNKTYYYRLAANTPIGFTPLSDVVTASPNEFTDIPNTPVSFSASPGDGLVALSWNPVDNATSYNVYMAKQPNLTPENVSQLDGGEAITGITNISTNRLQLENDTTYYFNVAAVNDSGVSPVTATLAATPKSVLPNVPGNVKAESLNNSIRIRWNAVEGATSYSVYWSNQPAADRLTAQKVSDIDTLEYVLEDLATPGVWYFFITANNESGESDNSAIVAASPILIPKAPPAPENLRIAEDNGVLHLAWDALDNVDEYLVYFATESGIEKTNYFQLENGSRLRYITNNNLQKSGFLTDTTYYFKLSARNAGGEGSLSNEYQFRTSAENDTTPPEIVASSLSKNAADNIDIALDPVFEFTFSEPLDPGSVNTESVSFATSIGELVNFNIELSSNQITITPKSLLLADKRYEIILSTDITDARGNSMLQAQVYQFSTKHLSEKPVITLIGDNPMQILQGTAYIEPGATAQDDIDGDISSDISITGLVNTDLPGTYYISYNVSDSDNGAADQVQRVVNVVTNSAPIITLNGLAILNLVKGQAYTEAGAIAEDPEDGDISSNIEITGNVDTNTIGTYTLTYDVSDSLGKAADSVVRTVNVVFNNPPVISLIGYNPFNLYQGEVFVDPGANASDTEDGNLSALIQVSGSVNTEVVGSYTLTYTVADSQGKIATAERIVNVIINNPPEIILTGANPYNIFQNELFVDPGASANDEEDGDLSESIQVTGSVNTEVLGSYTLTYTVADSLGKTATAERVVNVNFNNPPEITLSGANPYNLFQNDLFVDPGATANDEEDGDITASIIKTGNVDISTVGSYILTYNVTDSLGKTATPVQRTVNVNPQLVCSAQAAKTIEATGWLTPLTNEDLGLPEASGFSSGLIFTNDVPEEGLGLGTHTVNWMCSDSAENVAYSTQQVTIEDTTSPVLIVPEDPAPVYAAPGENFVEVNLGIASVSDLVWPIDQITVTHEPPGPFPPGITYVDWQAMDGAGNLDSGYQYVYIYPATPQNLRVLDVTRSSIEIAWDSVPGASFYNIYWTNLDTHDQLPNPGDGVTELFESVYATSFMHSGLLEDSIYYYVVTAYNEAGESLETNVLTQKTLGPEVAYYPFNGNAYDESGNGLDATVISNVVLTTDNAGNPNSAYNFNGVNSRIGVPHDSLFDITEQVTLEAWINPNAIKSQDIVRLGAAVNGPSASPYGLALSEASGGDIIFSTRPNGILTQVRSTGYLLNQWTHIVGVYDGISMKLYVNGELKGAVKASGLLNKVSPETPDDYPLIIGTRLGIISDTFAGKLDEIKIYDYALSAEEVSSRYNNSVVAVTGRDLIISALTVVDWGYGDLGQQAYYEYVITNIGTVAVNLDGPTDASTDNVKSQAFLSADTIFNNEGDIAAGGRILGGSPLGFLQPGASRTYSASSIVNSATATPFLTLKIDWGEVVPESDETNNTAAVKLNPPLLTF